MGSYAKHAVTTGNPTIARAFAVMQLVGCILIIIVLTTALLAKDIKRSFTWTSFCVTGILTCISYDLLFFAGQQTGPPPNHGLCMAQSALIHAVPTLQAGTNLALIVHTWTTVRFAAYQKHTFSRLNSFILLLMFPYILSFSLFMGFLMFAFQHPYTVQRDTTGVYCKIAFDGIPSKITAGIAGFFMLVSLIFEVILGRLLIHNWRLLCKNGLPLSLVFRVMIFSFVGGLVLGLTLVYVVSNGDGNASDFVIASLPLIMGLVFGTQGDIIRVWAFWRRPKAEIVHIRPLLLRKDSEATLE